MNTLEQAIALYTNGQHQEAFKLALANVGPLMNILAGSAQALGLKEDAEKYSRLVLMLQPQSHHAHNNLGLLHRDKGQAIEAEAYYQQAHALCPGYAEGYGSFPNKIAAQRRKRLTVMPLRSNLNLSRRTII